MLYVTRTPEIGVGGDTLWANMHLAYEMLSPPMRAFLDGLTAVHDGLIPWQGHTPPPEYVVPKSEHPVVVRHPETGRRLLFVNAGFTSHIVQLSRYESRALLDMLFGWVAQQPILSCRVRWTPTHAGVLGQPLHPAPRRVGLLPALPLRPAGDRQRHPAGRMTGAQVAGRIRTPAGAVARRAGRQPRTICSV